MQSRRAPQGLDAEDRVALGLTAPHLVYLLLGSLTAWAMLSSTLPAPLRIPAALVVAAAGAALAWGNVAGRPLDHWAMLYVQYLCRQRQSHRHDLERDDSRDLGAPTEDRSATVPGAVAQLAPAPAAATSLTQGTVARAPERRLRARRLVLFSLRGGTGKSTLAAELAILLASLTETSAPSTVALLDMDGRASSMRVRLGLTDREPNVTGGVPRSAADVELLLHRHSTGVRVALAARDGDGAAAGDALPAVLDHLDEQAYRYVIVDAGSVLDATARAVMDVADDIIYVFEPTPCGVYDLYQGIAALRRLGHGKKLLCVSNRDDPEVCLDEVVGDLRVPLAGRIPSLPQLARADDYHLPACTWDGEAREALHPLVAAVDPCVVRSAGGSVTR